MGWKSIVVTSILGLFILLLGYQIFVFHRMSSRVGEESERLQAKVEAAKMDQQKLQEELEYLRHPQNLEKELRARFHYKKPGEKLIIIVPKNATNSHE